MKFYLMKKPLISFTNSKFYNKEKINQNLFNNMIRTSYIYILSKHNHYLTQISIK